MDPHPMSMNRGRAQPAPSASAAIEAIPIAIAFDTAQDEAGHTMIRMHVGTTRASYIIVLNEREARAIAEQAGPSLVACADQAKEANAKAKIHVAHEMPGGRK